MTSENFVDVIGYAEEKVHTGILAWLVDSDNATVSEQARKRLLRLLFPPASDGQILTVRSTREYAFGKRLRIDLVLKATGTDSSEWVSVIECKTDSDVRIGQLQRTLAAGERTWARERTRYIVLAVGAGEFTYEKDPQNSDEQQVMKDWELLGLDKLLDALTPASGESHHPVVQYWQEALAEEQNRRRDIVAKFQIHHSDATLILQNRSAFARYYMYYQHLRQHLNPAKPEQWAIYSGSNNPVLNDRSRWRARHHAGVQFKTYWEFNWSNLVLKLSYDTGTPPADWRVIRNRFADICKETTEHSSRASRGKGGGSTSVYLWPFNFSHQAPEDIADSVHAIADAVDPAIETLFPRSATQEAP